MLTHIVFFKMKETSEGPSAGENLSILLEKLRALPHHIPQIKELEAGKDVSESAASFDIALVTRFANAADLETYRIHPEHQKVVDFIQKTTSDRAVVDYETT